MPNAPAYATGAEFQALFEALRPKPASVSWEALRHLAVLARRDRPMRLMDIAALQGIEQNILHRQFGGWAHDVAERAGVVLQRGEGIPSLVLFAALDEEGKWEVVLRPEVQEALDALQWFPMPSGGNRKKDRSARGEAPSLRGRGRSQTLVSDLPLGLDD